MDIIRRLFGKTCSRCGQRKAALGDYLCSECRREIEMVLDELEALYNKPEALGSETMIQAWPVPRNP